MQSYYAFALTDFSGLHTVAGNAHRVYLASEVDARIAELERELEARKAAIEGSFALLEQVRTLTKSNERLRQKIDRLTR